ncbi:MAG: hypothetical protein ACK4RG_03025 [Fimbriimonadales bacterium]
MAKPIPINRRWQENQRSRQGNDANPAPAQPQQAHSPRPNPHQLLVSPREPLSAEASEPHALAQAVQGIEILFPPRVIPARYRETCTACGALIHPGDPITRHPHWGDWVHEGCRNRSQRAARRVIEARYRGFCPACARPIVPGQPITPRRGYGWVHLECAPDEPTSGGNSPSEG